MYKLERQRGVNEMVLSLLTEEARNRFTELGRKWGRSTEYDVSKRENRNLSHEEPITVSPTLLKSHNRRGIAFKSYNKIRQFRYNESILIL